MPDEMSYDLTIGSQQVSNKKRDSDRQLLALSSVLTMDGMGGRCLVELGDPESTPPMSGDPLTIKLDNGEGEVQVFKGEVDAVETTASAQRISASDSLVKMAQLDVEAVYENVTVDFIVKELMQQAGITPGTIEKGPKLPSFVLFRGPRALRHIQGLAELCSVDIFTDGDGKAHFAGSETKFDKHTFQYGDNVLELCLKKIQPTHDSIEVWGEGAASSQGAEKYYWLPTDLSSVHGKAAISKDGTVSKGKAGSFAVRLCSGAVRSGEAAANLAEAHMKAVAARPVQGNIKVFGAPLVKPGDTVVIERLPEHHSAAAIFKDGQALRVRQVKHMLNMKQGFLTSMDF